MKSEDYTIADFHREYNGRTNSKIKIEHFLSSSQRPVWLIRFCSMIIDTVVKDSTTSLDLFLNILDNTLMERRNIQGDCSSVPRQVDYDAKTMTIYSHNSSKIYLKIKIVL